MNIKPSLQDRQDFGPERIAGILTQAAEQLDSGTVDALRRARHAALERQAVRAPAYALAGRHGHHWPIPHTSRQWLAATLLLTTIALSVGYWQHLRKHEMMTHLDVAILTDDMPMEVFIDHRYE